ncbi:MAG: hypothetical protein EAZ89_03725 [Bacteroidetes bacterium]|nr:MAG: hypothetical protein EAZ89_03725 [Bacteroidota bacterium]
MRKSQFSESQRQTIVAKLDAGHSLESICREHQISPATFYSKGIPLGQMEARAERPAR